MVHPNFIHLHTRSDYSMIDSIAKVNELLEKAKLFNMPALALTDFTNLFGLIKFHNYSYELGIKPITGSDFCIQDSSSDNIDFHEITCLVINSQGYQNLIQLISKAYKYKSNTSFPVIKMSWLQEYNKGLILLSGGRNGDIGQYLLKDKKNKIDERLSFYNNYFPNRYYIELIRTGREYEELYLQLAIELSKIKGLPVVATNDIRFINEKDFLAHEIRVAIHDGVVVDKIQQLNKYSKQQFMKNAQDMCLLFKDVPESLTNTVEIAQRCNCIINLNGSFLPKFPTGSISIENFLIKFAQKGLEKRLLHLFPDDKKRYINRKPYDERLSHELHVIIQMGFPGYFLIVMEFIQWAKNNKIPVGPGRGSGASSLVAYVLTITELDPIKFDLLFERFLNPERISMPDLDIDFCMEHRDLVIDHVVKTYGSCAVAQIITFGTMAAKAVIRDVGRALGYPYTFINSIAKLIPSKIGITLSQSYATDSQLKLMYDNNEEIKKLIDLSLQLEGLIRNVSKHAGGVVIAPSKITDFSPLYYDSDHTHPMTQFDKNDIERIGLIKFDFLGLRTLTVIDRSLKMINNLRLKSCLSIIDINQISLNDQESFDVLQTSKTTGIFQLESRGIKALIKRLKPDCFEDLIALIALFRPGPLQSGMVDNFINRKHGYEAIYYPDSQWEHKSLRPVLKSTYGIILYQEQVMQIAQVLAGYTPGKADILRRAIGKKKPEDMAKQRSIFIDGAVRNGIDKILSKKIFDLMEKFAGYGFNKSHSVAYALLSYQTLWLKTHYPAEFMASTLNSDMDNLNRTINLLNECKRIGLKIHPPDINNSQYYFCVNKKKEIVYGIGAIKGIGKTSIDEIVKSRNCHGEFKGLFDFCVRIENLKINFRMVEKLIFSGAFDSFKTHRSKLLSTLKDTINNATQYINKKNSKQTDMFETYINTQVTEYNVLNMSCMTSTKWNNQILLEKEKETVGLYLTNHPVDQYIDEIEQYILNINKIKDVFRKKNNEMVCIFGLLSSVRIKLSKKGNYILFGILEDKDDQVEIVVFSKLLKKYHYCLKENNLIFIEGILNYDEILDIYKIIVHEIQDINDLRKRHVCNLSVLLHNKYCNKKLLHDIYNVFKKNQLTGGIPVYFLYQVDGIQVKLRCHKKWNVILTDQLLTDLRDLVGYDQIVLELNSD
ncbi:DNA polymerase III subunit alpha [Candidatus Blochmanniella vafra str. BVAF]|uniref:DNA polymerase III subunit alpha n=1 Tax=Blochmanniella vafra (strain BVAF) TaxID=859654 RepID=E8Q6U0_BLOVB|nr:DNA polymerase III subunit alpha [Candidatus Blochmannia vafer]ADV33687.1 DNA polymerase III subunit alpha [Candidatus Blochmannia vafer str. BVAF]